MWSIDQYDMLYPASNKLTRRTCKLYFYLSNKLSADHLIFEIPWIEFIIWKQDDPAVFNFPDTLSRIIFLDVAAFQREVQLIFAVP